jgi:hypothetical protein
MRPASRVLLTRSHGPTSVLKASAQAGGLRHRRKPRLLVWRFPVWAALTDPCALRAHVAYSMRSMQLTGTWECRRDSTVVPLAVGSGLVDAHSAHAMCRGDVRLWRRSCCHFPRASRLWLWGGERGSTRAVCGVRCAVCGGSGGWAAWRIRRCFHVVLRRIAVLFQRRS